jgi:hypothetical protein
LNNLILYFLNYKKYLNLRSLCLFNILILG